MSASFLALGYPKYLLSVEALLGLLLEADIACGVLQAGSSPSCCGVPVSAVQCWYLPSPALLALGGVLPLPGV